MKPSDRKLNLTSYDEIFQTEETRIEATQEKVIDIPLTDLHPFKNHPFKVTDDESMLDTAESITKHGVLVPVIARPREEVGYELISRHRRKRASALVGKEGFPYPPAPWPPRTVRRNATHIHPLHQARRRTVTGRRVWGGSHRAPT